MLWFSVLLWMMWRLYRGLIRLEFSGSVVLCVVFALCKLDRAQSYQLYSFLDFTLFRIGPLRAFRSSFFYIFILSGYFIASCSDFFFKIFALDNWIYELSPQIYGYCVESVEFLSLWIGFGLREMRIQLKFYILEPTGCLLKFKCWFCPLVYFWHANSYLIL